MHLSKLVQSSLPHIWRRWQCIERWLCSEAYSSMSRCHVDGCLDHSLHELCMCRPVTECATISLLLLLQRLSRLRCSQIMAAQILHNIGRLDACIKSLGCPLSGCPLLDPHTTRPWTPRETQATSRVCLSGFRRLSSLFAALISSPAARMLN